MQLSILETQHMRELQRLKGKQSEVSYKELLGLREDLLRKDIRLKDMEKTVVDREQEVGRIATRSKEEWQGEVKRLREAKTELERKLKKMRLTLDEYVKKLKDQVRQITVWHLSLSLSQSLS